MEDVLPLLHKNVLLNSNSFLCGPNSVQVQRLDWTKPEEDVISVLHTLLKEMNNHHLLSSSESEAGSSSSSKSCTGLLLQRPLLIIAADCVYYESLHVPLEQTLSNLLSSCSLSSSLCVMTSVRRWKRDNRFYSKLGKQSRHNNNDDDDDGCGLICELMEENVRRYFLDEEGKELPNRSTSMGNDESIMEKQQMTTEEEEEEEINDKNDADSRQSYREVTRTFCVQWSELKTKKKKKKE